MTYRYFLHIKIVSIWFYTFLSHSTTQVCASLQSMGCFGSLSVTQCLILKTITN